LAVCQREGRFIFFFSLVLFSIAKDLEPELRSRPAKAEAANSFYTFFGKIATLSIKK